MRRIHWYTAEKAKTNDTKVIKDQTYCCKTRGIVQQKVNRHRSVKSRHGNSSKSTMFTRRCENSQSRSILNRSDRFDRLQARKAGWRKTKETANSVVDGNNSQILLRSIRESKMSSLEFHCALHGV